MHYTIESFLVFQHESMAIQRCNVTSLFHFLSVCPCLRVNECMPAHKYEANVCSTRSLSGLLRS